MQPVVPDDGVHAIVGSELTDGPDREGSSSNSLVATVSPSVNVAEVFQICAVTRAKATASNHIMKEKK